MIKNWKTYGEKLAYELRFKIIRGELRKGDIISENQLANEFNISRSPVRDSLKMLAAEGLIRLERMGAVIVGLEQEDLVELYEVRHMIESFALRRIVQTDNSKLVIGLKEKIDRMKMSLKHGNFEEFAILDYQFHESIIHSIEHKRINYMWNHVKHVVWAVLYITTEKRAKKHGELKKVIDEHNVLILPIEQRDLNGVESCIERLFSDTFSSINKLF